MFTDAEKEIFIGFVDNNYTDDQKKSILKSLINRTKLPRHKKLNNAIHKLKINKLLPPYRKIKITSNICKQLIDKRNKLFHRGKETDDNLLNHILFPLVTLLAKRSQEILCYYETTNNSS